jgi:hypothetical protein
MVRQFFENISDDVIRIDNMKVKILFSIFSSQNLYDYEVMATYLRIQFYGSH